MNLKIINLNLYSKYLIYILYISKKYFIFVKSLSEKYFSPLIQKTTEL